MTLRVDRLDHLVLNVRDVERAAEWYAHVLGMERRDFVASAGGERRIALYAGAQKITLRPVAADPRTWLTADNSRLGPYRLERDRLARHCINAAGLDLKLTLSSTLTGMDLTTAPPRSVRDLFAGLVMLGRTTDKARANNARSLGDYDFGCPMDRGVLSFLGIEPAEYAQRVAELGTDVRIEAWVRESYLEHKATADVERFNNEFLVSPVPLPDGHPLKFVTNEYFYQLRTQLAPDRSDLTSLADILDVDENRPVPQGGSVASL